jgi:hypothetical protein
MQNAIEDRSKQAHMKTSYQTYITSAAWRDNPARIAEFAAAGHRCRICNAEGAEAGLEAHHRTYERFGKEEAGDLLAVCRECHRVITDHLRRRRYARRRPATADVSRPIIGPLSLVDPTARRGGRR